jgi:hypothetical protein
MTIIEARYVGPVKVPEWGTWLPFPGQRYELESLAEKALRKLRNQFRGLYEFRIVKA